MNEPMRDHELLEKSNAISTSEIVKSNGGQAVQSTEEIASRDKPNGGAWAQNQQSTPLFSSNEAQEMRSRWSEIQAGFVDAPRPSVENADKLVATAIQRLAEIFAEERSKLEKQWDRGDQISTEDLRLALQRYRSFFTRLLSI